MIFWKSWSNYICDLLFWSIEPSATYLEIQNIHLMFCRLRIHCWLKQWRKRQITSFKCNEKNISFEPINFQIAINFNWNTNLIFVLKREFFIIGRTLSIQFNCLAQENDYLIEFWIEKIKRQFDLCDRVFVWMPRPEFQTLVAGYLWFCSVHK